VQKLPLSLIILVSVCCAVILVVALYFIIHGIVMLKGQKGATRILRGRSDIISGTIFLLAIPAMAGFAVVVDAPELMTELSNGMLVAITVFVLVGAIVLFILMRWSQIMEQRAWRSATQDKEIDELIAQSGQ